MENISLGVEEMGMELPNYRISWEGLSKDKGMYVQHIVDGFCML